MFLIKAIKNTLFSVDTRILAVYRILFGSVLLFDILNRFSIINLFYSSKSIFPTSYILSSPYKVMPFTLLPAFNQPWEIKLFFSIGVIACIFFILGYRTKLFQIIASIVVLSIHNKLTTLENGGDMVVNNFIIWSLFLPLGLSYSIDSIKNSLKKSTENTPSELNTYKFNNHKILSFAYFACLVQIAMIYFFNYKTKTGSTWTELTSLHYFFELDSFLTPIGYWAKDFLTAEFKELLTKTTLIIEMSVPILIFFPFFTNHIRRICFIVLVGFHLCIGIFMDIGMFSWIMIAIDSLLLSNADINLIKNVFSKIHGKSITLIYDSDCGICHQIVRIIKRIDVFGKITFYGNEWVNSVDPKFDDVRKMSILIFKNSNPDKIYSHHFAFFHLLNHLPFGFLIGWLLLIPGVSHIVNFVYKQIANNRTNISNFYGLNACGIPSIGKIEDKVSIALPNRHLKTVRYFFTNLIIFGLLIANIQKSLVINEPFKSNYDFKETQIGRKVLKYFRMKQNWKMFAPGVLKKDVILVVDLTTVKGERIDPFTGKKPLDINSINFLTEDINYGQYIRKFMKRSVENKNTKLLNQLEEWLKRPINDINGNRYSKAKNYKVWKLTQYSSKPGNPPGKIRKDVVAEYIKRDNNKSPQKSFRKKNLRPNLKKQKDR